MQKSFGLGIDQVTPQTQLKDGYARAVVNLDATQGGRLELRPGVALRVPGTDVHSLWAAKHADVGYYVDGSTLYAVDETGETLEMVTGLAPGLGVSYAGLNGDVYWSNGVQSGVIVDGANTAWGPQSVTGNLGQTYLQRPRGTIVRAYRGRLYLADDTVLWATEPLDYMRVDAARGFIAYEARITLFEPVAGGCFIGVRGHGVRFLAGYDFKQFSQTVVDRLDPVPGSGLGVDGADFGATGDAAVWLTTEGWVLGLGDGSVKRITSDRLAMPAYVSAASMVRERNGQRHLISFARGGESANAGDVLTSSVIRNGVLIPH